jgi:outer membrane protein OmpA-like peptidoglycan-associated protein
VVDKDTDGDGILDKNDKCPLDPEDKDGFEDDDGCPDLDNDKDGIPDKDDKCPNDPEDKDGFEDDDGCPDPDNDKDGIPDDKDKCPNEPETVNGYQDEDGCPDEVPAPVKKFVGPVQGINFATNQAKVLPSSFKVLDKAVKVMTDFPEIKFEISGHTDDRGTAEYNKDLSQRRAQAVVEYLLKKGIAKERLISAGYGLERPLADNKTAAGRAKNRRTEFKLISETEK